MSDAMSGLHLLGADPLKQTPAERQAAWEAGNRASMEIAARGAAAHDANMAAFANMKPVERKRYFQMYPGLEQTFLASPYAAVAASATQCAADGDNGSWMFWILCMLLMWLFWRVAGHWAQAPPRHHASRGGYVPSLVRCRDGASSQAGRGSSRSSSPSSSRCLEVTDE